MTQVGMGQERWKFAHQVQLMRWPLRLDAHFWSSGNSQW